ncbi:MAG: polyphenol oxidase family protein [Gammaproteobacteria bacterium]|nr:polyphenol oxidase family protein [Gammaproteobacteria bacterium]
MPLPQPGARSGSEPVRRVTEAMRHGRIPMRVHPEWARAFPWVVQGTTVRTGTDADFGLFTGAPAGQVMKRWESLAEDTGCGSMVHARQIHGRAVTLHEATPPGLLLAPPCDGHATRRAGTLLAVSVADCVPVFVVAPRVRAVMLLHAGWRGVAGGILEAGLVMLERDFGTHARETHMHMGPAICGRCYEVGREVHEALGLPRPASRGQPVDLRRVLADRALAAGADPAHLTTSSFCTRCADAPFFSHRGGDAGRQIAVLGITPDDSVPPGGEWLDDHRQQPHRQPVEDR